MEELRLILLREEDLNLELSPVILAGLIPVGNTRNQLEQCFVPTAPSDNHIPIEFGSLGKADKIVLKYLPFYQRIVSNRLFLFFLHKGL